jgi:hypothetical protein
MVTVLIESTVVPMWDGQFVRALNDAVLGVSEGPPNWEFGVMNDQGETYRKVIVHGAAQHRKLFECLLAHRFSILQTPAGPLIRLLPGPGAL